MILELLFAISAIRLFSDCLYSHFFAEFVCSSRCFAAGALDTVRVSSSMAVVTSSAFSAICPVMLRIYWDSLSRIIPSETL